MKRIVATIIAVGACVLVLLYAVPAQAVFSLSNGNTAVSIDPNSQAGVFAWSVDGVNQLYQQWFWYRLGTSGGESAINAIPNVAVTLSKSNPFLADNDTANLFYYTNAANPLASDFIVEVKYTLSGGTAGSHTADLDEVINITNHTGNTLNFFQYSDFDLGQTIGDDILKFVNANAVQQYDTGEVLSETVVTPAASHYEGNIFPVTLNELNDGSPTTLDDVPRDRNSAGTCRCDLGLSVDHRCD